MYRKGSCFSVSPSQLGHSWACAGWSWALICLALQIHWGRSTSTRLYPKGFSVSSLPTACEELKPVALEELPTKAHCPRLAGRPARGGERLGCPCHLVCPAN